MSKLVTSFSAVCERRLRDKRRHCYRWKRTAAVRRLEPIDRVRANGWNRHNLVIAGRSDEGSYLPTFIICQKARANEIVIVGPLSVPINKARPVPFGSAAGRVAAQEFEIIGDAEEVVPQIMPLYAARIADLGPVDFVKVDCSGCGHTALLTPMFLPRLGLSPRHEVLDLKDRVRCRGCGARG